MQWLWFNQIPPMNIVGDLILNLNTRTLTTVKWQNFQQDFSKCKRKHWIILFQFECTLINRVEQLLFNKLLTTTIDQIVFDKHSFVTNPFFVLAPEICSLELNWRNRIRDQLDEKFVLLVDFINKGVNHVGRINLNYKLMSIYWSNTREIIH